ncbi:MAG: IS4 family transposase, partial [Flavobacteriaceae bacterium]|nr:IS4 family transposase [Flavobacteriaceae bacterium]
KAWWLFNNLKAGQHKHYDKIVSINGQYCYLSGCKLQKGGFPIIVSFNRPEEAQADYAQRWQIEMCFKAMKSSGFDIEKHT